MKPPVHPTVRRRAGFTLVEVLVALAILSITGVVLATGFASFLQSYGIATRRSSHAADVALVRAALLAEPDREVVENWNDLSLPEDAKARWHATITPTDIADLFTVACEIELTDPREPGTYTTTLNLTLLRPTWSQADERETLRAASRDRLAERTFQ